MHTHGLEEPTRAPIWTLSPEPAAAWGPQLVGKSPWD